MVKETMTPRCAGRKEGEAQASGRRVRYTEWPSSDRERGSRDRDRAVSKPLLVHSQDEEGVGGKKAMRKKKPFLCRGRGRSSDKEGY